MRELLRNFQNRCTVSGADRALLLRKLIAAGIAYSVQVPYGARLEMRMAYEKSVLNPAINVISAVNEIMVVNVEEILDDTRNMWEARYCVLNSPVVDRASYDHIEALRAPTNDLIDVYNFWVVDFQNATGRLINAG